jgi:tripartite ATP-independent transporter DctM subunit
MDQGMSQIVLLAVPLFVILGLLMEMTGMAKALVGFLANLIGHVPGGLSYVLIGAMYLASGISGSKSADMAALAPVFYPEMKARGTKPGEFVALLSATATQTETIPPSLVLIILGSVTGVSIGALFTGGLLPGVVVGSMLCLLVWWRHRGSDRAQAARPGRREILRNFWVALPALALPFVIRFAVVEGATATEVSTIGILYTVLVGLFIYKRFDLAKVWPTLVGTAALSGAILLIIGAATSMAWCLTQSGFSNDLADMFEQLPGGRITFVNACDCINGDVYRARQPARRYSRGRAVRPVAVSYRGSGRCAPGALRDDRRALDGDGPLCAAFRRGLLHRLRHQPDQSRGGHAPDHGVYAGAWRLALGAWRGTGAGRGNSVDIDGIFVSG